MNAINTKISKFLAFILRHHPEKFDLELDNSGFADLTQILDILNKKFTHLSITEQILIDLINESQKKRYEISKNKIRALYGHSIKKRINFLEMNQLPPFLFHGTTNSAYKSIKYEGLKSKGRQYVHLSTDRETAIKVGKRRTKNPIILKIDIEKALKDGIKFYKSGDLFLADYIPHKYIDIT